MYRHLKPKRSQMRAWKVIVAEHSAAEWCLANWGPCQVLSQAVLAQSQLTARSPWADRCACTVSD